MQGEIVLPEAKPALEWILGRAVQKVSPQRRHSRLQAWWTRRLGTWAEGRGEAGPEWRFRVAPPGEIVRPLVPDVAYLSYARMGNATDDELEAPLMAPNVAVEILSPDDRAPDVEHKIAVFLAAGSEAVVVVDPAERTVAVHERAGVVTFDVKQVFAHSALPGLAFRVDEMFAELRVRRDGTARTS